MRDRMHFSTNPKGMLSLEGLSKDSVPLGLVAKHMHSCAHNKIAFGQKNSTLSITIKSKNQGISSSKGSG